MTEEMERKGLQGDERAAERRGRFLPVHDPGYVAGFVAEYFDELAQEARRACWKTNLGDFADDALSITIEKFMSSRIEDRGPRSAIAFAMRILKNTCIDEARRRGRQAILAGAMTGDLGGDDNPGSWIPEPTSTSNPETETIAEYELLAVRLGFEQLPRVLAATHKNVGRDLEIVRLRYLDQLNWEEIGEEMGIDSAHRQSAARGRELLRGWVHALCGTQPEPEAVNAKYWRRGFEVGETFRQHNPWPPTGETT